MKKFFVVGIIGIICLAIVAISMTAYAAKRGGLSPREVANIIFQYYLVPVEETLPVVEVIPVEESLVEIIPVEESLNR